MQSVTTKGLSELDRAFAETLEKAPEMRRALHEKIAAALKDEVDLNIDSSGINDSGGKVKDWQQERVGTGGGYAAIRPMRHPSGPNGPGAVTNYLEGGHRIRQPNTGSKRKSRARVPYVDGYHFYQSAEKSAESVAMEAAEGFAESLAEMLDKFSGGE